MDVRSEVMGGAFQQWWKRSLLISESPLLVQVVVNVACGLLFISGKDALLMVC